MPPIDSRAAGNQEEGCRHRHHSRLRSLSRVISSLQCQAPTTWQSLSEPMATLPGGDEGDVDPDLLLRRALHYADKAGVSQSTSGARPRQQPPPSVRVKGAAPLNL